MKTVDAKTMRELDQRTMREFEVPGALLMERAGIGVADAVQRAARASRSGRPLVQFFAGRGNNGGDAFAAARLLAGQELDLQVFLAGEIESLHGDALEHFLKMKAAGIPFEELAETEDWADLQGCLSSAGDILVDGLLGTGITGPARGLPAAAIQVINRFADYGEVIAIDVPSGLDADTGNADGDVVAADLTLTMGLPKQGLLQPQAIPYTGSVEVIDIGIPDSLTADLASDIELITAQDVHRLLPRRARDAHKGSFGHVLLIGGSPGLTGAMTLAVKAACRSGAGLVSALVPAPLMPVLAGAVPEAMVHAGSTSPEGGLSRDALAPLYRRLDSFDAILIGPGLGLDKAAAGLFQALLTRVTCPVIIDADALNLASSHLAMLTASRAPFIFTPHPGELARLLGSKPERIQADRFAAARQAVERLHGIIVLKGAGTLVAAPDRPLYVNLTGNPGMACGGMGDALAGLITGFIGQGIDACDAACAGVFLHGRAADSMVNYISQTSLTAGDVLNELPHTMRDVLCR